MGFFPDARLTDVVDLEHAADLHTVEAQCFAVSGELSMLFPKPPYTVHGALHGFHPNRRLETDPRALLR